MAHPHGAENPIIVFFESQHPNNPSEGRNCYQLPVAWDEDFRCERGALNFEKLYRIVIVEDADKFVALPAIQIGLPLLLVKHSGSTFHQSRMDSGVLSAYREKCLIVDRFHHGAGETYNTIVRLLSDHESSSELASRCVQNWSSRRLLRVVNDIMSLCTARVLCPDMKLEQFWVLVEQLAPEYMDDCAAYWQSGDIDKCLVVLGKCREKLTHGQ